jgi:hypothetical protein
MKVHIAGSAARDCELDLLDAAHAFVKAFTDEIVAVGGGLVLGVGAEPRGDHGRPCIFDWSSIERVAALPDPAPNWPSSQLERFVVVSTQSGLERVPDDRRELWQRFQRRLDVGVTITPPGWRLAAIVRERQVQRGDVLVVVGGGAGVEHLAQSYVSEGKPVIPIAADMGAYSRDGSGGSGFLHAKAISEPESFFQLAPGSGSPAGRLLSLKLDSNSDSSALPKDVARLVSDLRLPNAFYVRLLESSDPEFDDVEEFFRTVVDTVVRNKGFTPDEMGSRTPTTAFMNLDIFRSIHFAGLVIADLTGLRQNCTMELGYALARKRRVIICAKEGTRLPFDPDKLPTYFWSKTTNADDDRIASFERWFDQYLALPPLIE